MSVYFLIHTKNQPINLDIYFKQEKLCLKELHETFLPYFHFEDTKKYFYFIDGELNFLKLTKPIKNDSIDKIYAWHFQSEINSRFKAIMEWILTEINLGNEVSLIRQIECNDKEERSEFNSIYEKKTISLNSILQLNETINFDFNIEYEFQDS